MARRRALDDHQLAQLRRRWKTAPTTAALRAYVDKQGWEVGKSALEGYRRELWGPASEDVGHRVRRQVQKGAAPAPPLEGDGQAEDVNHRQVLVQQLRRAQTLTQREADPRVLAQLIKTIGDLSKQIREIDREGQGDRGPRMVFYFPHRTRLEHMESDEP